MISVLAPPLSKIVIGCKGFLAPLSTPFHSKNASCASSITVNLIPVSLTMRSTNSCLLTALRIASVPTARISSIL